MLEDIEGDLNELFHMRGVENQSRARHLYTRDVVLLFRPGIIRNFQLRFNNHIMVKNYIKVALRNASRYKGHTALNLLSLIIGIASCLLILLWIEDEVKVDKFHEKDARIYQLWRNMHQSSGEINTTPAIPQPMIDVLRNEYPEVDKVTLVGWDMSTLFRRGDSIFYETGKYASPEFFDIFSFPITAGDPSSAMDDISSVVISERLAAKYFGPQWKQNNSAIGQTLTIGDQAKDFQVSGVFQTPGDNSTLQFDWIIPAQEYIQRNSWVNSWYNGGFRMCMTLKEGVDLEGVQQRALQEVNEHTDFAADERIFINKYSDNYLWSNFENGRPAGGRIQYVRILFIIALFILVIACINFMNLATARSSRRSREIGVRKVLGAQKGALRQQFFIESFVLSIIAIALAVGVVFLVLPYFSTLTEKSLILDLTQPRLWLGLGIVTLVTGILSGSYPAFLLPSFKIISSLKGSSQNPTGGIRLREGLVVFQFALSILLIIGTLVVSQQMSYILNKNLGLDKENVLFVGLSGNLSGKSELYKTELLSIPEISMVTATSGNPIDYGRSSGSAEWAGKDPDEEVEINVLSADEDFVETMKIEIVNGRDFSKDLTTDTSNYLINEVTANIMGFEDPVGQDLTLWGMTGKIVGVVKNFHMSSMYEPIDPLIIRNDPSSTSMAFIRTHGNIPQTIQNIKETNARLNPGVPFDFDFLDQNFAAAYRSEMTLNNIVNLFALLSILISCLGLFGLSSYTAEQRSREIGIRKVYGASVVSLVSMLSWGYTKLILLAFILSAPVAAYVMRNWLNNFEYRTDLSLLVFALAAVVTFLIGALTVGVKSWQAALTNPVNILKEEG